MFILKMKCVAEMFLIIRFCRSKRSRRECVKPERERRSLCMLHQLSELNASQAGVRGKGRQSVEV